MELRISRRQLLQLLTGSYFSLWSTRNSFAQTKKRHKGKKIIVVGSGISGLSAARELQSKGFEVLILEGRKRLGGRIYTNKSLGFPVDLGASWIHQEQGNPITKIAKENSIDTISDENSWKYYQHNGQPLDSFTTQYIRSAEEDFQKAIWSYAKEISSDISYGKAANHVLSKKPPNEEELLFIKSFLSGMELTYGTDIDVFSLLYGSNMDSLAGGDLLFPEGYDQIPKTLSRNIDIRYSQTVSAIDYTQTPLKITTNKGDFKADAVILSVPLGVLKKKRIIFTPTLPTYKLQTIDRMGFGLLNKIVLYFPKVFWPTQVAKFCHIAKEQGGYSEFLNWYKFGGKPVLIGFIAGSSAEELEHLSDYEIVSKQMNVLRKIFGTSISEPQGHLITRWSNDSFTYGSYSHIPVGGTDADYSYLAQPLPRLFFAGEATSRRFPGTVHGAFLSGIRAANEVEEKFA